MNKILDLMLQHPEAAHFLPHDAGIVRLTKKGSEITALRLDNTPDPDPQLVDIAKEIGGTFDIIVTTELPARVISGIEPDLLRFAKPSIVQAANVDHELSTIEQARAQGQSVLGIVKTFVELIHHTDLAASFTGKADLWRGWTETRRTQETALSGGTR